MKRANPFEIQDPKTLEHQTRFLVDCNSVLDGNTCLSGTPRFMLPRVNAKGPDCEYHMSQCMRFPTMWYVRPAKSPISLRIRAV